MSQEGLLAAGGDKLPHLQAHQAFKNIKECHRNLLLLP